MGIMLIITSAIVCLRTAGDSISAGDASVGGDGCLASGDESILGFTLCLGQNLQLVQIDLLDEYSAFGNKQELRRAFTTFCSPSTARQFDISAHVSPMDKDNKDSIKLKEIGSDIDPSTDVLGAPRAATNLRIEDDTDPVVGHRALKVASPNEVTSLYEALCDTVEIEREVRSASTAPDLVTIKGDEIIIKDEKANPKSANFDHAVFMQGVRQVIKRLGLHSPEMPIAFRDLVVMGDASSHATIHTIGSTLMGVIDPLVRVVKYVRGINETLFPPKLAKSKEILHGFTGVVNPGELVLVIGRPGSGCSTLLRTLANRTSTYKCVKGDIRFAGLTHEEVLQHYKGDVVFSEENDPHYPSLTVRQTLEFALSCRVDNVRVRERILEMVIKLYGLVGCQNTVVGDEQLRGVSGGEKKRTSLAEATCVGGAVAVFDGCTKGLDAASALDFVHGLRNFADFQNRTVVASCYQASDAMFDLFDKVIVLADGYCCYNGPASQAVDYFEAMGFKKHPRDTKAEYLTATVSSGKVSPLELFTRYKSSPAGVAARTAADAALDPQNLNKQRESFENDSAAVRTFLGAQKGQLKTAYNQPFSKQAALLILREIQIIRGNPGVVIMRYVFNALMAIIVGSIFFQLPADNTGAFTRGGALFFSLLFTSVTAMSELPKIMHGRPVLYKHRDFALYRSSTYFLTQYIFNFFLDLIQIVIFACILYFMCGFQKDAGKFFFFITTLLLSSQAFSLIIKAVGNASAGLEAATQRSGALLITLIIYSGYIVPFPTMKPWFQWINWINALGYGFKSLMINEFSGLSLNCTGISIIPPLQGPYAASELAPYHTCYLAGAIPGRTAVDGLDYLQASFDIDSGFWGYNLVILVGYIVFFLALNCIIVEVSVHGKAGVSLKLYDPKVKNAGEEAAKGNSGNHDRAAAPKYVSTNAEQDAVKTLLWGDIVYTVPHPKDKKKTLQLLDHVSGYAKPGTLTALMGSSGAGKTTMLDVVAGRKTIGTIEGSITVGAKPQGKDFTRFTGYCEQIDVHNKDSTVREALRFAAYMRQPKSVSVEEKDKYCEEVIELLELEGIADALIGELDSGIGLNMEERKRLTIGIELVAKPKIMFLDEPTSGLDSEASTNIVRLLKNLAAKGQALVVTIHQPSAMLFSQFDRLLLLGRGGKMIYFGDLGEDCQTMLKYFESKGAPPCDPKANPAEYILECIGAGTASSGNNIDWFSQWKASEEWKKELAVIADVKKLAEDYTKNHPEEIAREKEVLEKDVLSPFVKTRHVMRRMFRAFWRSPEYNIGRVAFQIVAALIIGQTFYQVASTPQGAQNRVFAIFQTSVIGVVLINMVMPVFITQREFSIREISSGTYNPLAFAASITTVEIPFAVIASTAFFLVFYWAVGLNPDSLAIGYFFLMLVAFTLWAISYGQMIASFMPNLQLASAIVPITTSILALFCGVTVPYDSMPSFYRAWLYWIDPYHYMIEGLIVNDLHGLQIECDSASFVTVTPPPGSTCAQYLDPFIQVASMSGASPYLLNGNDTTSCLVCPISVGDTYFKNFSWSFDNRWWNLGIIAGFWVFNRIMTVFFVQRFKVKR